MVQCLVNDSPRQLDSGLKTWGDLLKGLDKECTEGRQTVTAVRFDGVDQPSFRVPAAASRSLARLKKIDVEVVDRVRLLHNTLGTAGRSLPSLAAAACRAGQAFRGHDLVDAHQQLTSLVGAIRTLTMLTAASAAAAGADLERLPCGVSTAADILGAVGVVLDVLAQGQQGNDWAAVADALELDLAPTLLEWGVVFDAIQDRCAA